MKVEEPDYDGIDAHLASAHKYLTMAHEQIDELIRLRKQGLDAWAELDGIDVHNRCGLAHGWAEHAYSDLGRLEHLTKPPIRETDEFRG